MITKEDLKDSIREAKRFLKRAKALENAETILYSDGAYDPGKLTAGVKRASMDLTRSLVNLRSV